ncbi:hypothetical protein NA57DRAFT_74381 [Rhizodiscina lignyota]|uniref:Ilp is an apoptosis inhibitor n=1 Tax=Rhizodiscina lignyota TaxID=1504668 RepID=A0A9P4IK94_9PEZI|nr:hypothetical protein NA57DRAFT_74381 [Rhizodiscina lignyota]
MSFSNLPNGYPTQPYANITPNSRAPIAGPSNAAVSGAMNRTPGSATGGDAPASMIGDPQFDIFEWYPAYQSCQRYFLDHAQYDGSVQAVAALINICLPFQWTANPIISASGNSPATGPGAYGSSWQQRAMPGASTRLPPHQGAPAPTWVSLVPYMRRLVVTGFDREGVLHGFFGDDWRKGVGPLQECERRNYLFAAKSVGWAKVKYQYDISPYETVPFLKPLQNVPEAEIENAEKTWSQWLAMEDWMLGERAPERMEADRGDNNVSPRS